MKDLGHYFAVRLIDMSRVHPDFAGIMTPESEIEALPVGLTAQFTVGAADYAAKYASSTYFRSLIEKGLTLGPSDLPANPSILDIGTGAGDNSVFPCIELFGAPEIVATDLSPNLLRLLSREALRRGVSDTVSPVCADAMLDLFKPECFDFVIGAAILHHLIDPALAVNAAFRALKPGGVAMFIEPFELGHSLLAISYERLIAESALRGDRVDPTALHFMNDFCEDVRRRLGRDKSSPIFRNVDDKWLFSESYFSEIGRAAGFSALKVASCHPPEKPIETRTRLLLALVGSSWEALAPWMCDLLRHIDAAFCDARPDLLTEAIVVMHKATR